MARSRLWKRTSISVAEAITMRNEINVMLQASFSIIEFRLNVIIKSSLIKPIQTQINTPSHIAPTIEHIWDTISSCEYILFTQVYHEGNMVEEY